MNEVRPSRALISPTRDVSTSQTVGGGLGMICDHCSIDFAAGGRVIAIGCEKGVADA
jgi:hypothetical protein